MTGLQCCVWLLAEIPSSLAVFDLNNLKSGVNRHLRFCQFLKNPEMCRAWVRILKWIIPTQHGTLPSFLEIDKTAGAYSLQIWDYLSQIQRETKAFLLIARHNTEGQQFSDCQWFHRVVFFFIGLKNRVNLVLFFKPWVLPTQNFEGARCPDLFRSIQQISIPATQCLSSCAAVVMEACLMLLNYPSLLNVWVQQATMLEIFETCYQYWVLIHFELLEEGFINTIKFLIIMQDIKVIETKTSKWIILSSAFTYSSDLCLLLLFKTWESS